MLHQQYGSVEQNVHGKHPHQNISNQRNNRNRRVHLSSHSKYGTIGYGVRTAQFACDSMPHSIE